MIASYDWAGGREAMLRFGPAEGPVVVAALPLFEEANRTRAFVVAILRALAGRGIAGALPDLPGTGESLIETRDMTLPALREAFAAAVTRVRDERRAPWVIAVRSGALVETLADAAGRWHLAPQTGEELLRELTRIRQAAAREAGVTAPDDAFVGIAGNLVSRTLLDDLASAHPQPGARAVRLDGDPREADLRLLGSPLWRRAEPGTDPELAERLADDIASWIRRCGG
ncbi:MAG: hypothetical protein ABW182_05060 [Sphingomonas sp.]